MVYLANRRLNKLPETERGNFRGFVGDVEVKRGIEFQEREKRKMEEMERIRKGSGGTLRELAEKGKEEKSSSGSG